MTRMRAFQAGLVLSAFLLSGGAQAAGCPIEKAVYEEADAGFSLRFMPAVSETSPLSHRFVLSLAKAGLTLEGHVMYDDEAARPVGMAMHNCPEGDVTGEDLRACTIWQGVIYSADEGGTIDILPPEGQDAPTSLLLPGFGPDVRQSRVANKVDVTPWDVFTFKSCAS